MCSSDHRARWRVSNDDWDTLELVTQSFVAEAVAGLHDADYAIPKHMNDMTRWPSVEWRFEGLCTNIAQSFAYSTRGPSGIVCSHNDTAATHNKITRRKVIQGLAATVPAVAPNRQRAAMMTNIYMPLGCTDFPSTFQHRHNEGMRLLASRLSST